jgi:UDP:flavonoid glycosyltransferase YjiC (YdhE family)
MAKLLFTTLGSLGDLHPPMGIAVEMQRRGHSVTMATSEYYRQYVENAGLRFKSVRPNIEPHNKLILRAVLEPIHGSRILHEDYIFPSMADYYADLYPSVKESDLFVSSILGYVAPLLAKTTGTRWVNALLSPMALWSAFEPPVLPPVSFFRFLWGKSPKLNRLLLNTIFKSFESMGEPMQLLREQVGLPRINLYREGQHSSPLLLCLWSPLFGAPQPDWPKEAETPGFVFYDPKLSSPLSTELESFINNGPLPLVFTLGSTQVEDATAHIELFIDVAKQSHQRAVITVGKNQIDKYRPLNTSKLLFVDYAPYEQLFPKASLIIHQGGVGTTGQALKSGRPMIVTPTVMDQLDNAVRIKQMEAGTYILHRKLSVETLTQEIHQLLKATSVQENCQLIKTKIEQENGVSRAADALEKVIPN